THDPHVSGPGPSDAAADHDGPGARRGAAQPLPGADGRRGPGADTRDPSPAARTADAGRPAGRARPRAGAEAAPGCPAAAPAAPGREPLRPRADLSGRPHADAAGSSQVPDADPRARTPAPAPASAEEHRPPGR